MHHDSAPGNLKVNRAEKTLQNQRVGTSGDHGETSLNYCGWKKSSTTKRMVETLTK